MKYFYKKTRESKTLIMKTVGTKEKNIMEFVKNKRRTYGEYLTSISIFKNIILPEIKQEIYTYR